MLKNELEQRDASSSSPQMGVGLLGCADTRAAGAAPPASDAAPLPARGSRRLLHEVADAHEVVDRRGEGEHPVDSADAPVAGLAHEPHGLEPAEDLLDELALLLADQIARMARGAAIDRTRTVRGVLRDVRRDPEAAKGVDERAGVI